MKRDDFLFAGWSRLRESNGGPIYNAWWNNVPSCCIIPFETPDENDWVLVIDSIDSTE